MSTFVKPFPRIETDRLHLTRMRSEDRYALFELYTHSDVLRYYDLDALKSRQQAHGMIAMLGEQFELGQGIRWAIRVKGDEDLVGTCGFNSWDGAMRHAFIGYDLRPEFWGNGYALEAVRAMLDLGFSGKLPCGRLHRVQADIVPENRPSKQLLARLGFRLEGVRREAGYWDGKYHDLKCYGLLRREFKRTNTEQKKREISA